MWNNPSSYRNYSRVNQQTIGLQQSGLSKNKRTVDSQKFAKTGRRKQIETQSQSTYNKILNENSYKQSVEIRQRPYQQEFRNSNLRNNHQINSQAIKQTKVLDPYDSSIHHPSIKDEKQRYSNPYGYYKYHPKNISYKNQPSYLQKYRSYDTFKRFQMIRPAEMIHGLPNIGNSCYLNSIIQFMYSSVLFRESILNHHHHNNSKQPNGVVSGKKKSFLSLIQQIFKMIPQKTSFEERQEKMMELLLYLQKELPAETIKDYAEQDSLHILLEILELVSKEDDSLMDLFLVYGFNICVYRQCKNYGKKIRYKQYFLVSSDPECSHCKKPMKFEFILDPKVVILMHLQENSSELQFDSVSTKTQHLVLKGKIYYYGNGKHGHYTACRKIKDSDHEYAHFNDGHFRVEYFSSQIYNNAQIYLFENVSSNKGSQQYRNSSLKLRYDGKAYLHK